MTRLRSGILLVAAALWVWTSWLQAGPDPAQLTWLDSQHTVLHWDNVEGAPDWLEGPAPQYSRARGIHLVVLRPGESVLLRFPARERLRLLAGEDAIHPGDVEVEWSNGSGLYVQLPLQLSQADGSLLTAAGDARSTGVMRVTRPATFDTPVSIALFRSRQADPVRATSYRRDVDIPDLPRVRLNDHSGIQRYRVLQAGESASLPVQGATRYRLETRVIFPAAGEASQQSYRVDARLDGKPWHVFEFEAALDSSQPVAVDGCVTPLGQRVRGYLNIPGGARQLELHSTAPVYLRLQEQLPGGDYLWTGNRPLQHTTMQQSGAVSGSIWDLDSAQLMDAITAAEGAEPPARQAVLRLLQDNRWRGGGLTGSSLARRELRDYATNAALRQQADSAWMLHTRYHDLLPATGNATGAQQFAWFRTPVLRADPGQILVPERYADILAAQLAGGYFLEVPAGPQQYDYLLPERAAASRLRISIARNSVSTPTRLYLQLDDAPPRTLRVAAPPHPLADEWQPGRAEAALAVINHAHGTQGQSLAGPFAARRHAAPLLDAGFIELPLPHKTQRVRIWREAEQGAPVRLALQYRDSRRFRLAGAGYQALVQALGPDAVFRQLRTALTRDSQDGASREADTGSATPGPAARQAHRAHDLYNQWLPLLRQLHARHDRLAATLQSSRGSAAGRGALASAEHQALREAAAQATAAGDPVAALEAWTAVWRQSSGKLRDEATLARASLLEQLGEAYLAEQQLRSLLFDAASEAMRTQALDLLLARYRRAGNDEAIFSVLAAAVVADPKPAVLRALADSLQALGKTHEALQITLALPAAEQSQRLLLEASYEAGWWTLFETQLARLGDTPAFHRWAGLQAQAEGDYPRALAHWAQGGALTAGLHRQLSAGLDIRTQLASTDSGVRRQAVQRWEQWQPRHPGTDRWQAAAQLVTRHAGTEALYNVSQDQSSIAFRATPDTPVTLQVHGPVTLRIAARGLHASAAAAALDDWVTVADGERQTSFPVTDNRPAPGLQLRGAARPLPGQAETFEYRVAPGAHTINIAPEHAPLLLQVAAARPRQPLSVLPPLTAATVQAALQGDLGAAQGRPPRLAGAVAIDVLRHCSTARLLTAAAEHDAAAADPLPAPGPDSARPQAPGYHTVSSGDTLYSIARRHATTVPELARLNAIAAPYTIKAGQRLRVAGQTRAGPRSRQQLQAPRGAGAGVTAADTSVYVVRQGDTLYSIARRHATTVPGLAQLNALAAPYKLRIGQRLQLAGATVIHQPAAAPAASAGMQTHVVQRGDTLYSIAAQAASNYRQLAALNAIEPPYTIHAGQRLQLGSDAGTAAQGTDRHVLEQMRRILWLAEHDERQATAMVARGEALFQQHPDAPGIQRLLRRLRRAAAWELVPAVQASAGVRLVEVPPGLPEYPGTRIRKALLPGLRPGEQLISGFETLVFAVDQPARTQFQVELALEELSAAPAVPMQVQLQLDDGPERALLLTAAQPGQTLTQPVPSGNHLLRVRIDQPVLNQFLRVFIREPGNTSGQPLSTRPGQRSYHVATRDEPVVIDLEGPTRLRIDELRAGRTLHRYRNIAAGWQQLRIEAGPDQQEALFRIHRLTTRPPAVPLQARQPVWDPLPVPLLAVPDTPSVHSGPRLDDRFSLGGQEDGTWSLTTSLVNRRSLDEDRNEDDSGEEFMELRASHRFFAAGKHSYFRTDLLTRLRDTGGTTLGLREKIDIYRPDWPLNVALGGSLYLQRPDTATGTEWAASLRARLWREFDLTPRLSHRPHFNIFQRWLSLDETPDDHSERVDQDLFTRYKDDHRRGLGFGETLSYRPWLDTLWYTAFGLVSNTDLDPFDPDHIGVKLGAKQLLGDWQASAEYALTRYFQDADRDHDRERQRAQLAVDWLGWRSVKNGLQGRVQLDWDKTSGEYSGLASISWHWSNARFYRDFSPSSLGFRSIRRRRMQEQLFADRAGDRHGH